MSEGRIYRQVSRRMIRDIVAERWTVGMRLPTEKALAQRYEVSRGTIGEALTALEVMGLVDLSAGKGARLVRLTDPAELLDSRPSESDLAQARALFEGEAAALAAVYATRHEIEAIHELALADAQGESRTDRAFHLAIAQATHNAIVFATIAHLWDRLPAGTAEPAPGGHGHDHLPIALLLRERDPAAVRTAMRRHIGEAFSAGCQVPEPPADPHMLAIGRPTWRDC